MGGGNYGQNIANAGSSSGSESAKSASSQVAHAISEDWYNDERDNFLPAWYGAANPLGSAPGEYRHFTQIVWAATKSVGCATHFCDASTGLLGGSMAGFFHVCNYGGPGTYPCALSLHVLMPRRQRRRPVRLQCAALARQGRRGRAR
jgi:hypothetical protein